MIFYNYLKELKWSYTHNHGLFLNENEIVELTRGSETEVQEKIALNCYGEAHTEGKSKKPLGYNICNLRRTAATGAFASGHPAEPNGHLH